MPSNVQGTGPAGPMLTPEEWDAVSEIIHRAPPGTLVDTIDRVRAKVRHYQERRDFWREDARRRRLENPL